MPPLNQRVKELVKYYSDGKPTKFGPEIGLKYQSISRLFKIDIRNGKFPEVSSEIIKAIINTFTDINIDWLMTGNGNMLNKTEESSVINQVEEPHPKLEKTDVCTKCQEKQERIEEFKREVESLYGQISLLNHIIKTLCPDHPLPNTGTGPP